MCTEGKRKQRIHRVHLTPPEKGCCSCPNGEATVGLTSTRKVAYVRFLRNVNVSTQIGGNSGIPHGKAETSIPGLLEGGAEQTSLTHYASQVMARKFAAV